MNRSATLPMASAPGLTKIFAGAGKSERGPRLIAYTVAGLAHLGFAVAATNLPKPVPEITHVTEVELAPPPPPPPPPPPQETPPEPPQPEEKAPVAAKAPTTTPQVARAGNVVTAKEDPARPDDSEAVSFVTDPEGKSFGSGVVARGGTLDHATGPLRPAPPPAAAAKTGPPSSGDAITPAANLSRTARLEDSDPCAGRYPANAKVDDGFATISLVVRADGRVTSASIVSENPPGEGFGVAARECLKAKTLSPARNKAGDAVNAAATIRVRFSR